MGCAEESDMSSAMRMMTKQTAPRQPRKEGPRLEPDSRMNRMREAQCGDSHMSIEAMVKTKKVAQDRPRKEEI
jgi:ribosome biogenesis SPOUT family RNA methylase Rps3